MFNRLKSIFRSRTPPKQLVRARFDAAQTTRDNWRHWSAADHLSADMEAAPEVRRTLRMRSRYEVANNSYARGLVQMLANCRCYPPTRRSTMLWKRHSCAGRMPFVLLRNSGQCEWPAVRMAKRLPCWQRILKSATA